MSVIQYMSMSVPVQKNCGDEFGPCTCTVYHEYCTCTCHCKYKKIWVPSFGQESVLDKDNCNPTTIIAIYWVIWYSITKHQSKNQFVQRLARQKIKKKKTQKTCVYMSSIFVCSKVPPHMVHTHNCTCTEMCIVCGQYSPHMPVCTHKCPHASLWTDLCTCV
jgi:hypothetical protein